MNIIAFDLSLRSTGYATYPSSSAGVLVPPKGLDGIPRIRWIRDTVRDMLIAAGSSDLAKGVLYSRVDLVVLEGYAFAAHASHAHELGELGGVIRVALTDHGVPWCDVPPTSLKKFATGSGVAKKEQVLAEAIRRLKYQGSSHDEADALWLVTMARAWYGRLGAACTVDQRKALAGMTWPQIPGLMVPQEEAVSA